jgi:two-component system, NarL family, response regulator LiaR
MMSDSDVARVLLVDDHRMVRQGLIFFLSTQPEITIVGEAETGEQALELIEDLKPDVVLLDLVLPTLGGIDVLREIHSNHPTVDVIILSSFVDNEKVRQAIQAGAAGYLMKDVDPDELVNAIRSARRGELYLHPEAARRLAEAMRPGPDDQQEPLPDVLTEREREVLELVTRGLSNQEIADHLSVGLKTVKSHMTNIFQKLELENRVQAALYALRHHIVQLDELYPR